MAKILQYLPVLAQIDYRFYDTGATCIHKNTNPAQSLMNGSMGSVGSQHRCTLAINLNGHLNLGEQSLQLLEEALQHFCLLQDT